MDVYYQLLDIIQSNYSLNVFSIFKITVEEHGP